MKFAIQRGDVKIEVEAEGPDAAQLLAQLIAPSSNGNSVSTQPIPFSPPSGTTPAPITAEKMRTLFQELGDSPWHILLALFDHPNGLTDQELKTALESKNVTALAGSMSAIAKGCMRLDIDRETVLVRTKFRDHKRRGTYFRYKLGNFARFVMESMGAEGRKNREVLIS